MSANQAIFPIATMARVLGASEAGHHAWRRRPPSVRATSDAALPKRIRTIHAASRGTHGAARAHAELWAGGERHGRKRVARLMREASLAGVGRRRGARTTQRDARTRPAPDLVERAFTAERPNQLWVAGVTYIPTWTGFLYLAVVLDAFSRRVVAWAELFWYHLRWGHFGRAACLGFANTFRAFGFRRDFIDPKLVESLSGWLKVFSAAQTIIGFVLLFFFGLAVRNRFRMMK